MSIQDCLSLDKEAKLLCVFIVLSEEEEEQDLGEEKDACCPAFSQKGLHLFQDFILISF